MMLASISISIPALLLLASVAVAQEETPSVATSPLVSPTPSEEQIYTIQTTDPWACYEDCIQPPCPPCTCQKIHSTDFAASRTDTGMQVPVVAS